MPITNLQRCLAHNERRKVGMLLPPPVLLFITVILGVAAHLLWMGPLRFSSVGLVPGGLLVVLSSCAIGACIRRFTIAGTPFRPIAPATAIVSSGLYRVSRNPMYLGMAGILLGLSLLLGSCVLAFMMLPFLMLVHFGVVLPEERYLEALHGDAYREYTRRVRRWL